MPRVKKITKKISSLKLETETEGPFAGISVTVFSSPEGMKKVKKTIKSLKKGVKRGK